MRRHYHTARGEGNYTARLPLLLNTLAGELDKSGLCGNVSSVLGKKKKKKRRHRTIFTSYQLEELEKAFKVEVELSPRFRESEPVNWSDYCRTPTTQMCTPGRC